VSAPVFFLVPGFFGFTSKGGFPERPVSVGRVRLRLHHLLDAMLQYIRKVPAPHPVRPVFAEALGARCIERFLTPAATRNGPI